jgi:hypothetical protein
MGNIFDQVTNKNSILLRVASFSVAVIAVVNVWAFYKNNIWKPKIILLDVDYDNGVSNLKIGGRDFLLRGSSEFLISYDWGIKFGQTYAKNGDSVYDRIELTKHGLVYEILGKK